MGVLREASDLWTDHINTRDRNSSSPVGFVALYFVNPCLLERKVGGKKNEKFETQPSKILIVIIHIGSIPNLNHVM